MTPAARVQAAIELLDQVIEASRAGGAAADTLIVRYFKERRYAGSKDRRAVRELVYQAIRRAGERPRSGRAAMLGLTEAQPELQALFDGSPHAPAPIAALARLPHRPALCRPGSTPGSIRWSTPANGLRCSNGHRSTCAPIA
jgi:hypothetical protein